MTASHRSSSRHVHRRREESYRRSRSVERYHRSRRSRRSRSASSERYRYRTVSRSPGHDNSSYRKPSSHTKIRVDSPEPSRCLGVFGLSVYTTEPYLRQIFSQYGTLEEAIVIYDAKTRLSRGFGFVYFQTVAEASWARTNCNGVEFHGRRIRVDFSITDRPHPPTPGVYKGRKDESSYSSPPREYSRRERANIHDDRDYHRRSESRTRH